MSPYVALLRGINVGGARKVPMSELRELFEQAGMSDVRTYIASGNVIFTSGRKPGPRLERSLEEAIERKFGFEVPVLVRDADNVASVVSELPGDWRNDASMKCDVMFLWSDVDAPSVLDDLVVKPGIDEVRYVPGAVLWAVDREQLTRSGMMKMAGTPLYKRMTIRNCNTVRKLAELMG